MKENDIETSVLNIIQTISQRAEPIGVETNLRKELNFDSLTTLMVMNELDDTFGIVIKEEDFKDVVVVADVVRLLQEKYPATSLKTKSAEETVITARKKDGIGS